MKHIDNSYLVKVHLTEGLPSLGASRLMVMVLISLSLSLSLSPISGSLLVKNQKSRHDLDIKELIHHIMIPFIL
jgi:hypothetical protein